MAGFISLNEKDTISSCFYRNMKKTKQRISFMWWRLHADKMVNEPICDMSSMPLIDFPEQSQWRQACGLSANFHEEEL